MKRSTDVQQKAKERLDARRNVAIGESERVVNDAGPLAKKLVGRGRRPPYIGIVAHYLRLTATPTLTAYNHRRPLKVAACRHREPILA
jgi:hypothetical protein